MSEKRWVLASAAAFWLASVVPAMAGDAVALVMSVSGKVSPSVVAYSEIPADTSVDLGQDGRISFVHYPSCRQVTVVGGKLIFGAQEVEVEGGTVERESPQKCPKKLQMKTTGVAAAVRTRSLQISIPTATLAERPNCILVGDHSRDYAEAQILKNSETIATVAMNGPALTWPANAATLQDGGRYKLKLVPALPTALPQEIDFMVARGGASDADCLLQLK